jgi:hypothetical protein
MSSERRMAGGQAQCALKRLKYGSDIHNGFLKSKLSMLHAAAARKRENMNRRELLNLGELTGASVVQTRGAKGGVN